MVRIAAIALGWMLWSTVPCLAEVLATVNGQPITSEEVEAAFNQTRFAGQPISPEDAKRFRDHILDLIVNEKLVQQFLDQHKIRANEKRIDEHIQKITAKLAEQGATLEKFLAERRLTQEQMRTDLRNLYRWMEYVDTQATPAVLRKYFEADRSAFDGSVVRASHILAKVEPEMTDAQRRAAKTKLETLRAELAKGGNFAELARAHSDCPSKDQGGDLSFFPRKGSMVEPFAAAAFTLKKGEVSEVVETEFGYHLILVTDRRGGQKVDFDTIKEEVKGQYADDLRQSIIEQMRAKSDIRLASGATGATR